MPEKELVEQVKRGNDSMCERLQHENHHLKDCLLIVHSEMKNIMDQHFIPLFQLTPAQIPIELLDELQMLKSTQYKIE